MRLNRGTPCAKRPNSTSNSVTPGKMKAYFKDPIFGSAHCALAHYWSLKMNKCDFLAYQASRRNGTLEIHLDKEKQRVLLRGKAVTVMEGYVLV
ncbi:unnamed protein product [Brassica rapa subsp. trilocularis]